MQNVWIKSQTVNNLSNIVLGLFSPFRFGLPEYMGYDIKKFKDNIRFLEVIVNRDAEMGGILPLFFDGATCNFKELPLPDDKVGLQKWYTYLDYIRKTSNPINKINTLFFNFSKKTSKTFCRDKINKYLCNLFQKFKKH